MGPVARAASGAVLVVPSADEVHGPDCDLQERPASLTESLHPEEEQENDGVGGDDDAMAPAASSPPSRRRRGSMLRRRRRIVSPQKQQPKSASLLRRVLSRSAGRPSKEGDGAATPTMAVASIRRNLSDVFHEDQVVTSATAPSSKSPPHRFRKSSRRKKRKKKPAFVDDETTEEIIFKLGATKSVFESAWSTDDDASQSSSIRFFQDKETQQPSACSTPERMVHRPTAVSVDSSRGGGRHHGSSPISARTVSPDSPLRSLRYLLDSDARGVTKDASDRSRLHPGGSSGITINLKTKTDDDDGDPLDEHSIKIFVLLLQPEQKIFELIQLIFSSQDGATVGDLLQAIPSNATQPDLANQEYTGFTRPKKRSPDFVDPDTRVCSSAIGDVAADSIDVQAGEILVALPRGYSHNRAVAMSKKILLNPRIQKLLERTNPLAPRSGKSRRRSARHPSPAEVPLHTMEMVVEETTTEAVVEQDDPIKRVMDFAAELAKRREASSQSDHNAQSFTRPAFVSPRPIQYPETPRTRNTNSTRRRPSICSISETASMDVSSDEDREVTDRPATAAGDLDAYLRATSAKSSVRSFRGLNGHLDDASIDSSLCSSLQSYSSWSQSFDVSLKLRAGTPIPLAPAAVTASATRVNPYLKRSWLSARLVRVIVPCAGVVYCIVMVVVYAMDPVRCSHKMEMMQRQPLGVWGVLQVLASLVALTKLQRYALFGGFDEVVPVATARRKESRRYQIRSSLLR